MTIQYRTPEMPNHGESLESLIHKIRQTKHILDMQFSNPTGGRPLGAGWSDPTFDPKLHLSLDQQPESKYTFEELGIQQPGSATSAVAATSTFPLFTPESIPLIRKALLNPRYLDETAAIFGSKTLIVRNTAAYSPFFRRMWSHPSVVHKLSQAAGVSLEPVMETMELGHANIQFDFASCAGMTREETLNNVAHQLTSGRFAIPGTTQAKDSRSSGEIDKAAAKKSLIPWHFDSYPWVCVAMVSDTSDMVGGETVIRCGDNRLVGIAQPGMGSAMMLQGGLVKHLALPATSLLDDRITIVTSYRAKAIGIYDSSFMSNIRVYSDLQELYRQWVDYRLNRLEPGIKSLQDKRRHVKTFDEQDLQEEAEERIVLKEYAKRTLRQMVPESIVHPLVDRLGCALFYDARDDYVSGILFEGPPRPCQLCKIPGAVIEKVHLTVCLERYTWRPDSPLWSDCYDTSIVLKENGLEAQKRMEELQVKEVFNKWKSECRPWGIVDEFAVQGLGEYILEFLELCGFEF